MGSYHDAGKTILCKVLIKRAVCYVRSMAVILEIQDFSARVARVEIATELLLLFDFVEGLVISRNAGLRR